MTVTTEKTETLGMKKKHWEDRDDRDNRDDRDDRDNRDDRDDRKKINHWDEKNVLSS